MMKDSSRRKFLVKASLGGAFALCLPSVASTAASTGNERKITAKEGMAVLFQGDSITDGNRGRNNDLNHVMGHGYAFSVAGRLGADHPEKKLCFYNRGISGNKVNDLAKRWQPDTLDLKPDLLSILVGVNDSASVVFTREPVITVEKYEAEYRSLLRLTREVLPEVIFVLGEPFILSVGKIAANWEACHADMLRRQEIVRNLAAEFNAIFVGFQEVFDEACLKASPDYWIWDGVHPTVAGHELMAREWIKQVGKRVAFK